MNDPENVVYSACREEILSSFPSCDVSSVYVNQPSQFPHASIEMKNSSATSLDSSDSEAMTTVMFEVNVYSNLEGTKKTEAKSIMAVIDNTMYGMNFGRASCIPVPNMEDATIYRLVARYYGKTDGTHFYRR